MTKRFMSVVGLALAVTPAFAGPVTPACPGDVDGNGMVGIEDIAGVINDWGMVVPPGTGADLDGDGSIGIGDLAVINLNWGNICLAIVDEELAGNGLGQFPHFQFVQTFNRGGTAQIAIDTLKYPDVVGQSGNLYIVADKTAAQWAMDPTLTEVRASGTQVVSFIAGGIQFNRPTITDAATLSSGPNVSLAYDVVIDFNENGMLDGGDYIDGRDACGLWIVKDLTLPGPFTVTQINYTVTGVTAGFTNERTYYPSNIAMLGQVPLVVISHGNGHNYQWYDYLGNHLASYGYIVMSHANNTVPGIETASTTTLQHTDAILGQQGTISGGVLNGRINGDRIIWIGHSRGGEGVTRAYDRIRDGTFIPANYQLSDIIYVSSIAPVDFLGTASSNTYDANYHLIYGAADGDVCGCPGNDIAASFNLYERSFGNRSSNYMHNTDHNDFNCCGVNDYQGPAPQLGNAAVQTIAKAYWLVLNEYYERGNMAVREYLWRQYESLKPAGATASATVDNEFKEFNNVTNKFVIDDFQTNSATTQSSSGGPGSVTFDVLNIGEGLLNDPNGSFAWVGGETMNGMERARVTDTTRGVVFDYPPGGARFMEWAIPAAGQDTSAYEFFSFRACQGTRHPETIAELGDLTFTVTLRDGAGNTSSINFGAYGGGIEELFQRTGFGAGTGWQNEFETIRIRLADFKTNATALNLNNIVAVRFNFGTGFGNSRGRLGLDDLEFVRE